MKMKCCLVPNPEGPHVEFPVMSICGKVHLSTDNWGLMGWWMRHQSSPFDECYEFCKECMNHPDFPLQLLAHAGL